MTQPSPNTVAIVDEVPWSDGITAYDETHFTLYLRLLDAVAAGAAPAEMVRVILHVDPITEPDRAQKVLSSHLRRARWMTEHGYQGFIGH